MEIIQKEESGIVCLTIKGQIDTGSPLKIEKTVKKILKDNNSRFLFDLGNLEYLRSQGLRVILNAVKTIKKNNAKIILCSLNHNIKELFDVCGVRADIQIADSVESGIKQLS